LISAGYDAGFDRESLSARHNLIAWGFKPLIRPSPARKKGSQKSKIYDILKIPAPSQTRAGLLRFIRPFHKG
jgi:hypothetical protein